MTINTNKQDFIKTSLLLTGTTAAGTLAGYGIYKAKEKGYNDLIKIKSAQLEKENDTELRNFNLKCFETVRKNKNYKTQLDIFEKEGKVFGKDYHLKDILNEVDLKDYNRCVENLSQVIQKQKSSLISEMQKQISKNKSIFLVVSAISGLLGGIGINYLKQHLTGKSSKEISTEGGIQKQPEV